MDVHTTQTLERVMRVRTPENLELTYQLAGAGTRSAAYVIDVLLMALISSLLQNLIMALVMWLPDELRAYTLAVLGLCSFAMVNLYFILFELLWGGQSPGKRVVGIRVVKSGGYALRLHDSLVRNLLRVVDFIPLFYGVGLTSLLLTRHCQRVGDLVAGTLVVYQEQFQSSRNTPVAAADRPLLSVVQLGAVPADVLETGDEFLRVRDEIAPRHRQELADALIRLIERTSGLTPTAQSAESFLTDVISQAGRTAGGPDPAFPSA